MTEYDKNKDSSYIQYWDVNNLYGWATSKNLPVNNFQWIEDTSELNEDFTINYNKERFCLCFFNWVLLHARLNSHYKVWSYKKKKNKKIKAYGKSAQKEPAIKRCLLILDLKPFRSQVKGKYSIGIEFQSLAVR